MGQSLRLAYSFQVPMLGACYSGRSAEYLATHGRVGPARGPDSVTDDSIVSCRTASPRDTMAQNAQIADGEHGGHLGLRPVGQFAIRSGV